MRCCAWVTAAMFLLIGCSAPGGGGDAETGTTPESRADEETGRTLTDPAPDTDGIVRGIKSRQIVPVKKNNNNAVDRWCI